MPSPMSAFSPAAQMQKTNATASDAPRVDTGARATEASEGSAKDKPDFERMVRDDRRNARDARSRTHAPAHTDRHAANARADDTPAQAAGTPPRRVARLPDEPIDPPLALGLPIELPNAQPTLPALPTLPAIPETNPLLADASALMPAPPATELAFTAAPATGTATTAIPTTLPLDALAAALPATDAVVGDAPASNDTAAVVTDTPLPATPAPTDTAKPALQNLLSFAAHLASGNLAAAVPDAVALGKDVVDALRSDEGDSAAPAGNALAGLGSASSPLGLARTATVNAADAPSADLHGGRFAEEVGDSVRWMADQKIGHAHIRISPNDLGTVEVRLRLDGDRVHADFSSPQPEVRQALENSLPKLRDMLGQHGFQLAHADVGQQHQPSSQASADGRADGERGNGHEATGEADLPRPVRMTALGLLDAYA